tara:strand:- start:8 stop:550 length:543 start_codon:yes stop_codon:yes gene_type:complete
MNQVKPESKSPPKTESFGAGKFLDYIKASTGQPQGSRIEVSVGKMSRAENRALSKEIKSKIESVTKNSGIWALCALEEVRKISLSLAGRELLTEQIREIAEPKIGPAPNDGRAWGGVIRKAVKLGYLVGDGRWSPAKTSHGGPKVLWTLSGLDEGAFMTDAQKERARRFIKMNLSRADAR